ncbi:IS30 family transposase [Sulfitobacter faviae]|uniref:IS30 family transposase n=1 Tax=Sulfitobacter faviae TaxID=1775881 RepID=UPI00398CE45D
MGTHYCHLKLDERRKLAKWLEAKMPISEIADRLGRDPSTIYRDIKRNRYTDDELPELNGYHALVAQDKYEHRRAIHRKMIMHPDLKAAIEDRLKAGWSPEQIAGRMRLERHPIRVSHETIYRFAYSKDGREEQFYRHLPEHRRRRRPRGYRRHNRTHIFDIQSLSHRPERVSERLEFGHWECDLMMFRKEHGKVNVTSLVERVSRYAVVMRNEDRQSKPIMESLDKRAGSPARRRAPVDHLRPRHQVSAWKYLTAEIGADAWFCDPQAPYQKGTVENTNNRLRRYLPRSTAPTALTNRYLRSICHRLNATPRKCLGYRTPAEVFESNLMEIQNRLE